jgi:hypothetical protein
MAKLSKSNALLVIGEHRLKKNIFSHQRVYTRSLSLNMPVDTDVFSFFISSRITYRLTGYVSDLRAINYRLCGRHRNRSLQDSGGLDRHGD